MTAKSSRSFRGTLGAGVAGGMALTRAPVKAARVLIRLRCFLLIHLPLLPLNHPPFPPLNHPLALASQARTKARARSAAGTVFGMVIGVGGVAGEKF